MQLTEREEKMVSWLRQQHEWWWTTRVIILFFSCLLLGYVVWLYLTNTPLILYIYLIFFAFFGFSHSLGSWSGRPEISLLLKLIDESQKNETSK
jgi:hypothetical protein